MAQLALVPWSPTAEDFEVIDVITAIAEESEAAAVALAWLRSKGAVPIIGARKLEHLVSNPGEVALTTEQIEALDDVSRPAAALHGEVGRMLQFAGATVDGEASRVYSPLVQSDVRC
ncbi:hypothetical protein [Lentzea sp. NPDC060358]|uniref:hypothetical protein n=1 Tax=Lentzea sp. NPDC060358 TaxID=3347103 RepID=UPI0036579748